MRVHLDGSVIGNEAAFREQIAVALRLDPPGTLDSLETALSSQVDRPLHLVWDDANTSRDRMPEAFGRIVEMLRQVQDQDAEARRRDCLQFEMH